MATTSLLNATAVHDSGFLIDFLWPRVRDAYAALSEARQNDDAEAVALSLQFRAQALLLASEPARNWTEVEPKVAIQVLLSLDQMRGIAEANPHLEAMLEAAIIADHAALNGISDTN